MFKIDINNGERIYNCVNPKFLGNTRIDEPICDYDYSELIRAERLSVKYDIGINKILDFKGNRANGITYEDLLKDLLRHKYTVHNQVMESYSLSKERQVGKILNIFFYLSAAQVTLLNLCTFVFFNWDIMEPITTCMTYLNMIAGYYFWAVTKTDYEMESMVKWLKTKGVAYRRFPLLDEKEEIKKILNDKKI
jgi:hypothetical protein